jgi:hypothetical protein
LRDAPTGLAKLGVLLGDELIDMLKKTRDKSIENLRKTYTPETLIEPLNNVILILDEELAVNRTKRISDTIFDKAYRKALQQFLNKILPYTKSISLTNTAVLVQRKAIKAALVLLKVREKIKKNIKKLYDYQGALADLKVDLESIIKQLREQHNP